jgi:hypothetical protein
MFMYVHARRSLPSAPPDILPNQALPRHLHFLLHCSGLASAVASVRGHIQRLALFTSFPNIRLTAFPFQDDWPHLVPELAYSVVYIICAVMWVIVGIMLMWHLAGIARGETAVEAQDHDVYRDLADTRGQVRVLASQSLRRIDDLRLYVKSFVNSYDLG